MHIPIYTIFKSHKASPNEHEILPDGWTHGAMDGSTCWETAEGVKRALDLRYDLMKKGCASVARPIPIKNTLKIDENGIVEGAIYYKYLGVEYQCWVAQLILMKNN